MSGREPGELRERELTFDVPDGWQLPDVTRLLPDGGQVVRENASLESTYFDTAGRDLLRAGMTLRRRSDSRADGETSDAGWQLKIPDGDARTELRLPPGGRGVPAELRDALYGIRRAAALAPVAIVRVERAVHRLMDAAGAPLAEFAVDDVHATELGEFAVGRHWCEVEIELAGGDEALLARCARWLAKRGATPAEVSSKLLRALGTEPHAAPEGLAALTQDYLDAQYAVLLRGDLALRRGTPNVHATRTAIRRYRSTLRGLQPVLGAARAEHLEGELKWWAEALGRVRDLEVQRRHLAAAVADLPDDLVLGPVAARIEETLSTEERDARAALARLMRTKRYLALVAELADWHESAPVDPDAGRDVLRDRLAAAERRVRRRLRRAERADEAAGRDELLHSARKAAKRGRYLAELARPSLGRANATRKRMKRVQRRLGTHQDHVVAAAFLRRLGAAAGTTPGENGFTFGLLYAREAAAAQRD